jgi:hypothetical protein
MVVIHIDETNHLESAGHGIYLLHIMHQLYSLMASKSCFVPCLFTGTNAPFLISLKQTSSFRVMSINLPPLELGVMVSILAFVASQVCTPCYLVYGLNLYQIDNKNYMREHVRTILKRLIAEEGGNPQILRFQAYLMGELGRGLNDYSDSSQPSVPNVSMFANPSFLFYLVILFIYFNTSSLTLI